MESDEAILDEVAAGESPPTLRLYGWDPTAVSLGRFQTSTSGLDLSACERRGWDVVRRPTGGRAVLHDDELTYALVLPLSLIEGAGVRTSHCLITGALREALRSIFPSLRLVTGCSVARGERGASCFAAASPADLVVARRKLVGSAQVRRGGALLQHGSILRHVDREALAELFAAPGDPVGLDELVAELPSWEELQARLARGLATALDIRLTASHV
jgi:lipoate-protein ligase A